MVLRFGNSGIVLHKGDSAFKGPYESTVDHIEFENSVYRALGPHSRIAEYRGFKFGRIELKFYENGEVSDRISDPEFTIPLIKWADQILEALIYMHKKRIIHGDLRCPNILVTDELDLVLADFGSAAIDGIKGTDVSYDTRHCNPDTHDLNHMITAQDDLFAFGTVLYHLSARKLPFEDLSEWHTALSYRDGKFPDVSDLEVGHVIKRCWYKSYRSAIEVQRDLKQLAFSRFKARLFRALSPLLLGCGVLFILLVAKFTEEGQA